jgi:DNA-binding CsgD family transcriptional regulator
MIQYFNSAPGRQFMVKKGHSDEFAELTEREIEILDLIAQGHNNSFIAGKLSLSIKTVQNYVSSILSKLQVADRAMAIVRAREAGFGKKLLSMTVDCSRCPGFARINNGKHPIIKIQKNSIGWSTTPLMSSIYRYGKSPNSFRSVNWDIKGI